MQMTAVQRLFNYSVYFDHRYGPFITSETSPILFGQSYFGALLLMHNFLLCMFVCVSFMENSICITFTFNI